uniref:Uncharacterized protein n=1 Tax=Glycine max TaxID=3847 RepID=C6TML5_SOYBN|nr:unknown [Glycine max]
MTTGKTWAKKNIGFEATIWGHQRLHYSLPLTMNISNTTVNFDVSPQYCTLT